MKDKQIKIIDRIVLFLSPIIYRLGELFRKEKWGAYDPGWIVKLAEEQCPEKINLHGSLKNCTKAFGDIPYIHFVSPRRANKPGAERQFKESLTLEHPTRGELILDVLKDGRIGGVEFLGELLKESRPTQKRRG